MTTDQTGPISSSEWLARALAAYGVSHVFFVPEVLTPALAAMEEAGIRRISAHSEVAAAYMADGYARAARRPGICLAQAVGALNQAAGLREPYLGCSPVISLTGGPEANSRYRFLYQQVEDLASFEAVTKFNARVERPSRLPDLLRQAFRAATTGTPGPAHLEIPGRLGESIDTSEEAGLVVEARFGQCPPYRTEADRASINRAASLLASASRPVIVAGGGVTTSNASAEVVRLAELLQVPVVTTLNGKETILADHPLAIGLVGSYGRWCANETVAGADLVFFIGTRAGGMATENWKAPPPGTPVIQLDIEPALIGRNYPVEVGLVGDARDTLRRLVEAVEGLDEPPPERAAEAQARLNAWRAQAESQAVSDAHPIRPERLCREVTEWLPADGVVVSDTGHIAQWTGSLLELRRPGQRFIRCSGTLGWGLPGAIGVKCALPDRTVVCMIGDGGLYFHLAELETAARQGIPAIVIVNDNQGLSQTKPDYDAAHGGPDYRHDELWQYRDVDLARVATEMGCLGLRVEDPAMLRPAFEEAARAAAGGRPVVIDVRTDPLALPIRPWGDAG
jgi:acetolactate synthase I/II/III large subunit